MKKCILSLSILLLLLAALPVLVACGVDDRGSDDSVIDMFGFERPEYCFGTECLILPEYPELSQLFGDEGESGIVSEEALAQNGKLQAGISGYIVCVIYTSNVQDFSTSNLELTYCSGTQILHDGEGLEVGNVSTLGTIEAELDMSLAPAERLKVSYNYMAEDFIQGAIVIPVSFPEGSMGTLYAELSVRGNDMVNAQTDTLQEAQVGAETATAGASIDSLSVKYLQQSAYNNGNYDENDMQDEPFFENGEACYMVLDLGYHALWENDGSGTLNVLAYMPKRGAMNVTIEEAPTGKVNEVTSDNVTTIYATFSVLPTLSESKSVRMILRLLPVSGGTVELDIYVTGGEGTVLTGRTHVGTSFETGEPTFGYTLSDDGKYYTLTSILTEDLTVANIPDVLGDDLPVTAIASGLFRGNTKIVELVIGNNITAIEAEAFADCTALQRVTVGEGVIDLGVNAFVGCTVLEQITYNAVSCADKTYGKTPFSTCNKAGVVIGPAVKRIPAYLFDHTEVAWLTFEEGSVCETIGERAFGYCKSLERVEIPCGRIGESAFRECTALTSLTIGKAVRSIGDHAFSKCYALTEIFYHAEYITFTNGVSGYGSREMANHFIFEEAGKNGDGICLTVGACVTRFPGVLFHGINYGNKPGPKLTSVVFEGESTCRTIEWYAFYGQASLQYIDLPDSVTEIGQYAFAYSGLTSITLPDSVKIIQRETFDFCSQLTYVNVGNGVTQIGQRAFAECGALATVVLGKSLVSIAPEAFWFCDESLQEVFYEGDLAGWCGISFYDEYANPLYFGGRLYLEGQALTDAVIPAGVTQIKEHFRNCSMLYSVTIGNDVTAIGSNAFYGCNELATVAIGPNVTTIGSSAFNGCESLSSVTIGIGVTSIDSNAFSSTESLTTINYEGTKAEWDQITKSPYWCQSSALMQIICSDGTINF